MTAEQHRRIGAICGFPSCCVEAWIASLNDPEPLAQRNGVIIERVRPVNEARALIERVAREIGVWDDLNPERFDHRVCYVACDDHVGAPGWRP